MKRTHKLVVLAALTLATMALADGPRNIYRVLKFGPANVGIYCTNGADPTVIGNPTGKVLEVSCGR